MVRAYLLAAVMVVTMGTLAWGQGGGAAAPAATAPAATDVPVKIVVLYSSGVGYFEHYGTVQGAASTELRFKTAQINDILKSLLLQDLDGGKVTTVTYPSQDPLAKTLRSFQVDISGNPPLADLLNQLRGARLTVLVQTEKITGTVLGVEKKLKPVGDRLPPVEVAVLNLISGGVIRAVEMSEVRSLELEDARLQEELSKALTALAQARDQDKKPVSIHFTGAGQRRVKVGYVVEVPVWKTSYRLVLDEAEKPAAGKGGLLQGWAIVENQTDSDWNNVQLSLVSGRPISFIQDLYQPLYVPRPVVQPELYASLRPQTYDGGITNNQPPPADFLRRKAEAAGAPAPAAPGGLRRSGRDRAYDAKDLTLADDEADALSRPLDPSASVASVASASRLGELFQYTVGNVSLPRQRSAMIPILSDPLEVQRLSIYNQSVLARHPLTGARVTNTSGKHLLAGPVTVLQANAYAGDARIDNVPPGQQRLLSYGIDLQVLVDATKNAHTSNITAGKIVKGILHLTRKVQHTQEYLAENKAAAEKTLLIEHPLRRGWKLLEPTKPLESTETLYRFLGAVPASGNSKLVVKEEMIQWEQVALLPADIGQVEFYSRTGELPPEVREALVKAMAHKSALVDVQRQIEERQKRLAEITAEQSRIRENMRTVERTSQYYNRLLGKLNEQESQIEKLQTEIEGLQQKLREQRKAMEDYLMALNVG